MVKRAKNINKTINKTIKNIPKKIIKKKIIIKIEIKNTMAILNIINTITTKTVIIKETNLTMIIITKIKVIIIIINMIIKVKINKGKALTKKTITTEEETKEASFKLEINIIIKINIVNLHKEKGMKKYHLTNLIKKTIFKIMMINL